MMFSFGVSEAVFLGLYLAAALFGGGALLFVGARFIVKAPRASYWRGVLAMLLVILGSGFLLFLILILFILDDLLFTLIAPIVLCWALFWTWLVEGWVFGISISKSIKIWLPVLGFELLIIAILILIAI